MPNDSGLEPDRVKHLEMIQAVVARLVNEAALIRGWALTVSSAFFGLAAASLSARIAAVGLLPVVAFWGLNAYYLRAERQYRSLFDRVRRRDAGVESFCMNARGTPVVDGEKEHTLKYTQPHVFPVHQTGSSLERRALRRAHGQLAVQRVLPS
jgi:hypothetical protein